MSDEQRALREAITLVLKGLDERKLRLVLSFINALR